MSKFEITDPVILEAFERWNASPEHWPAHEATFEAGWRAMEKRTRVKHVFWGAGDPDCPKDIKAANGELHTLRCKNCNSPEYFYCKGQTAISNAGASETLVRLECEELRGKYNELIFAVVNKYPNESRHETALRYIRQADRGDSDQPTTAEGESNARQS